MRLTKYTHSCVRFDEGDRALVIDPGVFSETEQALTGAHAVLVTHEHPDHIDGPALTAAMRADPELQVWAPQAVADLLGADDASGDLGGRVTVVEPGQELTAGGFAVQTFGGQHALIHPSVPVVANVAYLVEGKVLHPGDSFTVPPVDVETLLLPLHAPWSKVGEVLDYVIAVRAPVVHAIHDSLLTDTGRGMVEAHVQRVAVMYGLTYLYLAPGEAAP